MNKGFTLLESLISLTFFSLIIIFSYEFYFSARKHFISLKEQQEINMSVRAALEKIKSDIQEAGMGLQRVVSLGLIEAVSVSDGKLCLHSLESIHRPLSSLWQGQTRIELPHANAFSKNRKVCFIDLNHGEICRIKSVREKAIILSEPLSFSYAEDQIRLYLIREISIYIDTTQNIIRRKVNNSSAQPLVENIQAFSLEFNKKSNLVTIRIETNEENYNIHETNVFPKNNALASIN